MHALECFFILGCQLELSAWTVFRYWYTPLGHHALPSDLTFCSYDCNWVSSLALVLSQEDEGYLSSPTCPILLQYLFMPRSIQTYGILLFNHPPSSQPESGSVLRDIPSSGFLSHLQLHFSRLLLHNATSPKPQNFSCFLGSCLCTLIPFYC